MKKILFATAVLMLIASGARAATAPTIDFPITVTINEAVMLEATVDPAILIFANQVVNTNVFSNGQFFANGQPRATVRNDGGSEVDLLASVAVTGGMLLGGTIGAVAENQAVFAGIWTYYNDATTDPVNGIDMVAAKFQDNDVLTGTPSVATTTNYFDEVTPDPAVHDGQSLPGYDVPAGETRSMRFMLQTPSTVTTIRNVEQTLTVTIGAQL